MGYGLVLVVFVCVFVLYPAAYADGNATMVMEFSASWPTRDEAGDALDGLLDGLVESHGHLDVVVGDVVYAGPAAGPLDGELWTASGNITVRGGTADLLAVEEGYGGQADSVVVHALAQHRSVRALGDSAGAGLSAAAVFSAIGGGLVAACWFSRNGLAAVIFGFVFSVPAVLGLCVYAVFLPYALPGTVLGS